MKDKKQRNIVNEKEKWKKQRIIKYYKYEKKIKE